ncbi:hypothetical protein HU720_01940 [Pseudomonas sp. SWRI51]|uniref:hypothetical protein n=1 Tax=Pseudomonas sp. SWRI51 TaxID=2745491 RepID=UPI00164809FD|nr:hypothetical protein [Pseudomonas sp. SWRI51]MBC3410065.1 hypothetical protein [Pseudomonas sp. SWRI51]
MHTHSLHLSMLSRHELARQVTTSGTFHHNLHDSISCVIRATASVAIEQCSNGLIARVELGESVNSLTLSKREDNAPRLVAFIESLANGASLPVGIPEVGEFELVTDLEAMLRDAVRERRGTFYLPAEGVEDLALLMRQSAVDPQRVAFRFELGGSGLTLPALLPTDREVAFELLSGSVAELVANYRTAA